MAHAAVASGVTMVSRDERVIDASRAVVRVRTALTSKGETLDEVAEGIDNGFDYDTRWAINWFGEYGFE